MIDQLRELAPFVYESNKSRGFWEQGLNTSRGERVMLMITELSEAVEAHRKNHHFNSKFTPTSFEEWREYTRGTQAEYDAYCLERFKEYVKDTVEDEIADVVIRILDYCAGFNVPIITREFRKKITGTFSEDVLYLTRLCIMAYDADHDEQLIIDWGYVLAAIIKFCEWYNIDLMQHIGWKLSYNASRPYKHGKRY